MIIVHFPPGARGDFLSGFLLDCISERDNFAVHAPEKDYVKIHHVSGFDFLNQTDAIKIRIDPNFNANNYVEIAVNHIIKNKARVVLDDPMDQHYMYIKDIISKDQLVHQHRNRYDYWLDFSAINNYNFLYDLYTTINNTTPDERLLLCAIENINKQVQLPSNYKKLAKLLDFEIKMNVLNLYRSFDYSSFINSDDPDSFLKLSNYSKNKFISE